VLNLRSLEDMPSEPHPFITSINGLLVRVRLLMDQRPRDRRKQLGTSEWLGGDGGIQVEKINWPFLFEFKGNPAEYQRWPQARDRARPA
jgi:hypothetical protein